MKLELKDFQEHAVVELYRHARSARRDAADGYHEALILAAPTGSGKTVIANALFERILQATRSTPATRPPRSSGSATSRR
jgi:type III restriction enzyme